MPSSPGSEPAAPASAKARVPALRLAFVIPRYGREVVGGAEMHARQLAERLAECGHAVEVYTTCALSHYTWENELPPGVERDGLLTIRRYPTDERDSGLHASLERAIVAGAPLSREEERLWLRHGVFSTPLEESLAGRADDYDFVIAMPYLFGTTYQAFTAAAERLLLIPCLHDEPYAYLGFVRDLLSGSRGVMFNAPAEITFARRLAPDLAPRTQVGLGFDPPAAGDPEGFARRHRLEEPFLLFVGRREGGKNTPLLTDYFLRYRGRRRTPLRLVFVGGGDPVPNQPGVVELKIDWRDRDSLYRAATVFCQPSVNESLSIVLMQAWLAERPTLVHGHCAVTRDHCERSNGGLWFTCYAEFEEVLDRLLQDAELRGALGRNGRAFVEREYSWETVLRRFHEAAERWSQPGTAATATTREERGKGGS